MTKKSLKGELLGMGMKKYVIVLFFCLISPFNFVLGEEIKVGVLDFPPFYQVKKGKKPVNRIQLYEVTKHTNSLRMLKKRRAPYLLNYTGPVSIALKKRKIKNLKSDQFLKINLYMMIPKRVKNAKEMMRRLERAYKALKRKGKA
ncbi:MAG: hypothetical protein ACI86H_001228 [bacterium]|jgi:hypothetical protein